LLISGQQAYAQLGFTKIPAQPFEKRLVIVKVLTVAQHPYGAHLDVGGAYQNQASSFGQMDFFMPLLQSPTSLFFTDIRGMKRSGPATEGNFGLGYRHVNVANTWLWGMYGFYDIQRSRNHNTFRQVTLGGEVRTQHWNYGINIYMPLGKKIQNVAGYQETKLQNASNGNCQGCSNIYYKSGKEIIMSGAEAQIGYEFFNNFTTYLGGYYFSAVGTKDVTGPRLRMDYDWNNPFNTSGILKSIFNRITFEGMAQYDKPRGFAWTLGVRFRFGLNDQGELRGVQRHMTDYIYRDSDIITGHKQEKFRELMTNGHETRLMRVANQTQLSQAIDNHIDVIAVNGHINNLSTITLNPNQSITGGDYIFTRGDETYSVAAGSHGELTAANGQSLLRVTQNNAVQNIGLHVQSGRNIYAIENSHGNSVGNLAIQGVTANGSVNIKITDKTKNSTIRIIDNTITPINQGNAIDLTVGENTTLTVEAMRRNHLTTRQEASGGIANNVTGNNGRINYTHGITHNTIQVAGSDSAAIYNNIQTGVHNGVIEIDGNIAFNQLTTNIAGIVNIAKSGKININGLITHNNFVGGTAVDNFASNDARINITGETNNTINTSAVGRYGFKNVAIQGGEITINRFNDNHVTTKGANADGLHDQAATGGKIYYNQFNNNVIYVEGANANALFLEADNANGTLIDFGHAGGIGSLLDDDHNNNFRLGNGDPGQSQGKIIDQTGNGANSGHIK
ncbi:MAG: hypothetical protein JKY13_00750, partial [Gammaproteobacteria bacterium]|nr:hypothetical protein [Gammaproteobacteria bacterium]